MGSVLSLGGTTVWNFELIPPHFEGMRMIIDPALLQPWLPLHSGRLLAVYDDLVSFLEDQGYTKNQDLYLWSFDWRLGMHANATKLAKFVNSINLAGRKLIFVAHSSGCMVVRAALHNASNVGPPLIDNSLVQLVVAAGPPMLGMASPFKNLIAMPSLDDTFDTLYSLLKITYPALADQVSVPINNSLMTVTAALEGIAPDNIPILSGGSGGTPPPFSAFDWAKWPVELDSLIKSVKATLVDLQATNWGGVSCTTIASDSHPTDTGYVLDTNDNYLSDWPTDAGDGSVLLGSAQAYCPTGNHIIVGARHRTLLDDPVSRQYLATVI